MNRRISSFVTATTLSLGLPGCYTGVSDFLAGDGDAPGSTSGGPERTSDADDGPGEPSECDGVSRLPRVIRGLNGQQYARTIEAVFPGIGPVEALFRDADRSAEFSTSSQIRRLDFKNTGDVIKAAEAVSGEVVGSVKQRFTCLESAPPDHDCISSTIETLSGELYRNPAPADHRAGLVDLFEEAQAAADTDRAIELVVRAMLTSPRFLFRQELGQPRDDGTGSDLTAHEVASALAYTLTDAPPDAELRAAAEADALHTPAQIEAHARRLLAAQGVDQAGMIAFVRELTGVRNYAQVFKDEAQFPEFDAATQQAVLADFEATVGALLGSDDPTLDRLLNGSEFIVSPASARLLGWDDPDQYAAEAGLIEVDELGRRGLLTHPAMMGTYSHEAETNPVARGHFVSSKLLCQVVPAPPPDVTFPDRDEVGVNETLRQTLERVHSVNACASCHQYMDPYGWPFEVFDAVGRRRDDDRGLPIDDTSTIIVPDEFEGEVNDVTEMLDILAASTLVHECVGDGAFKYVAGVGYELEGYACITDELTAPFVSDGDVASQFVRLLTSPWFLERRVEQ